jgi:peptidylprolyl isomerase domain and WD repeat-containing protein 1
MVFFLFLVVNLYTNRLVRVFGKLETLRYMKIALFQGIPIKKRLMTLEIATSGNLAFKEQSVSDPTLFTTVFKKNRFYLFSQREPVEAEGNDPMASGRDVFNEKPTREEQTTMVQTTKSHLGNTAILHTTMGDIYLKLFPDLTPKAAENFCTHAKNGYYNDVLFHRIIKGFMIQTGDPLGDGTGGESIWGKDFEDEYHPSLKHDRPYTLSMANSGPNTNGSQFFITTVPCPWLDQKHTIFGQCTAGMDTVHRIEHVRVNKTDKPIEDIKIINITIR